MEAKIIKIIDNTKVTINRGRIDNINQTDIFIVFQKDGEIFDPDTNESLGILEIPKLKMKVFDIQEKMTILESAEKEIIKPITKKIITKKTNTDNMRPSSIYNLIGGTKEHIEEVIETSEPEYQVVTIKSRNITTEDFARKIQ
ncbi:hypothetical protein CCAL12920_00605 [Campylobacter sp. RM12920]|uniref:Uncharacterized protein n=1 Tax=Campylobacter californiensis TaxID=1032243 RepID=A0ABD4JGE6_9BACT|nr:hypothetical protein [Campylobacter sp. RM12919]MBE2987400.1 hypothetical protein [Campylobacter sp. RM12920]